MLMNDEALEQWLIGVEGFSPYAYPDSKGFWTVGYGRCLDKRVGGGISKDEALYLLRNDIARVAAELDVRLPWWIHIGQVRGGVLADMAFNMGIGGLLEFHKMLGHVERGEWDAAADDMLDSNYARKDVPARAAENARRMRTGNVAVQP